MNKLVPDGWKQFSIKEIGTVVTGSTPPKKNPEKYGGDLPWIKPPDLDNEMFVFNSSETISEIGRQKIRLLPKGTVLISCIGNIGKIAIAGHELCTNQQINSIIPNEKIVDSVFLYFTIRRMQPYMQKIASKAVVPLLNKTDFSNIIVNLPPLPTQKKIVAILEKAEQLKGWRREADELTDELLKSTFLEMFGDPVKNQKGWEVVKFGALWKQYKHGYPGRKNLRNPIGTLILRIRNVRTDKVVYEKLDKEEITPEISSKYALQKGDLLMVRVNGSSEEIGRSVIFKGSDEVVIHDDNIIKIVLDSNLVLPEYIQALLKSEYVRSKIARTCKSTAGQYLLSKTKLYNIDVQCPPLHLQKKFIRIVETLEVISQNQTQSSQQIEDLFNALMQQAFRGELS